MTLFIVLRGMRSGPRSSRRGSHPSASDRSGITLVRTFTATAFANARHGGANDFSPPIANTGIRRGVFANVASAGASASKSLKYVKPARMVPGCA